MVAAVEPAVGKSQLSTRELAFVREYAANNGNAAAAYRTAYRYNGPNADTLAANLVGRPHIKAHMESLRDALRAEGAMDMRERRQELAKYVRDKRRFLVPQVGDRIAAIREDAILAGERRTDGTQISIGGDLNISVVLQSLRAAGVQPASAAPELTRVQPVIDLPSSRPEDVEIPHTKKESALLPVVADHLTELRRGEESSGSPISLPLLGPLGRVRGSGATLVSPGRQMAVESSGVVHSGASAQVVSEPYVCEE